MIPHLFLLASAPILSPASAQNQAQKPLQETSTEVLHELTLAPHLHYIFPSGEDLFSHKPPLHVLQHLGFYAHSKLASSVLRIPANATEPGHVVFSTLSPHPHVASDNAAAMLWVDVEARAESIPLLGIGVRRDGMVSMAVRSARLDLGTPFVAVPKQVWEVVVLATRPAAEGSRLWVDCERRGVFPDLVFQDEGGEEIVVTPWQYVLELGEERCLLLVGEMEGGELREDAVLGWSAVRGRNVIIDAVEKRMGIRR